MPQHTITVDGNWCVHCCVFTLLLWGSSTCPACSAPPWRRLFPLHFCFTCRSCHLPTQRCVSLALHARGKIINKKSPNCLFWISGFNFFFFFCFAPRPRQALYEFSSRGLQRGNTWFTASASCAGHVSTGRWAKAQMLIFFFFTFQVPLKVYLS